MSVSVIVLAAGKGTRMRSDLAKVLHRSAGRSLLGWVLNALEDIEVADMAVVVGHQATDVAAECPEHATTVVQDPQLGTGHAAMVGIGGLTVTGGPILVLPGDMPLLRSRTLAGLVERHATSGAAATIASVELDDPTGYGRIIRVDGAVTGIVEERDASPEQRQISEVNTSVYVFDGPVLADALDRLTNDNDQGEYYLTDVIATMVGDGGSVDAFRIPEEEGVGVNTQGQLAHVGSVLRCRINDSLLDAGVWMLDPSRVYIDAGVVVEPGARIHPDTYLEGTTSVASDTDVGPGVRLYDTTVASGARVHNTVAVSASIGEDASVGPFAYLRPGAVIERGAKVGTYVEIKGSTIGEGSKVPHLSYIGDTTIGRGSNIGAGTITVNYDGYEKHRTTIGDNVRIGSDTMLVAPVTVGDDAFTGAGSVITNDVPPGVLAIERGAQEHIDGYAEKRRLRAEGSDG
jgi:bifunctional UDP-N-acetylglucosamine pyrophosphorylase/glucosamine-1-phosphate N-acetyltransferase